MKNGTRQGEVYLCEWKKEGKKYHIRILEKPAWQGTGDTFKGAEQILLNLIRETTGDMQPCLEYKPEPPEGILQARFKGPGILGVSGANDPLDFTGDPDRLFSGGICPSCKKGVGSRTENPLIVTKTPDQSDGGYVRIRVMGPFGNMAVEIFSKEFRSLLSNEEKAHFQWIPVESTKKSNKVFFEPVSPPVAEKIMPKGLFDESNRLQPDGFHCQRCGRKQLAGVPQGSGGIYTFVSEADLPKPLPTCFQVGQSASLEFCMKQDRWSELAGKPGTKRIMSRQIGVVIAPWISEPILRSLP
jgi:hypothetical protein